MKKTFFILLTLFLAVCTWLAQEPNFEMTMVREVSSPLSTDRIARNWSSLRTWPNWFHSLQEASCPEQPTKKSIFESQQVLLKMDPKRGERKKFELLVEINRFFPQKELWIRLLKDSSGRLSEIFEELRWEIELIPLKGGVEEGKYPPNHQSLIRGVVIAKTSHWRSRLFGRMFQKILMNQILYPNVLSLSELKQPFHEINPKPELSIY